MATTYRRPGTYVEEVVLPQSVASEGLDVALGAFAGAALRGPVTAPLYVGSWTDFTRRFGLFRSADGTKTYRLALAVYQFFANGGRGAYIQRVVGSGYRNAEMALRDAASSGNQVLTVTALDPGDWAVGSLFVQVTDVVPTGANSATQNGDSFALTVFSGGASTGYIVERWTDLTLNPADARYAPDVINGSSNWISIATPSVTSTKPPIENTVPVALVKPTGVTASLDGAALTASNLSAAADKFDVVTSNLVFNVPDAYDLSDTDAKTVVNAFLLKADSRGDAFVVVDIPKVAETTLAGARTWATGVNASANGGAFFPPLVITNPVTGSSGRSITVAPGGAVAGMILRTDASRGSFKSPAGVGANLSNVVDTALKLTPTDMDDANTGVRPLNIIRPVPGAGVCVMGSRTLAGNQPGRYIATRRTLHMIKKAVRELSAFAVFENNDYILWNQVTTSISTYLNQLWQAGGLKGANPSQAFYVLCDDTNNTTQSINDGVLNIEVGVALQTPAEFVVIRIGQFDGATTVTEE